MSLPESRYPIIDAWAKRVKMIRSHTKLYWDGLVEHYQIKIINFLKHRLDIFRLEIEIVALKKKISELESAIETNKGTVKEEKKVPRIRYRRI